MRCLVWDRSAPPRAWIVRAGCLWLLGLLLAPGAGCVEPELGDIPFKCNNGIPACPEGYRCVQRGLEELCVREGYSFPDSSAWPDAVVQKDAGSNPIADSRRPASDSALAPDMHLPKWDRGPVDALLDVGSSKKDSGESPLLCQTNADCTDQVEPCCCPMPLLPIFKVCLSFCLDPICLPL